MAAGLVGLWQWERNLQKVSPPHPFFQPLARRNCRTAVTRLGQVTADYWTVTRTGWYSEYSINAHGAGPILLYLRRQRQS